MSLNDFDTEENLKTSWFLGKFWSSGAPFFGISKRIYGGLFPMNIGDVDILWKGKSHFI